MSNSFISGLIRRQSTISFLSFVAALSALVFYYLYEGFYLRRDPNLGWCDDMVMFCSLASIVLGFSSIIYSKTKGIGLSKQHALIFIGFAFLGIIFILSTTMQMRIYRLHQVQMHSKLDKIHNAINVYCKRHDGLLPDAQHWNDLLLQYDKNLVIDDFKYPSGNYGIFIFAFNENLSGKKLADIPRETVLIVESQGGWNYAGNKERIMKDLWGTKAEAWVLDVSGNAYLAKTHYSSPAIDQLNWEQAN